jgi:hypothetical protein
MCYGPPDLILSDGRATSADDNQPVCWKWPFGNVSPWRISSFAPVLGESLNQSRTANRKRIRGRTILPEKTSRVEQRSIVQAIEKHHVRMSRGKQSSESHVCRLIGQSEHVQKFDFARRLLRQVQTEIAFVHWRHGMVTHRRMPIDSVNGSSARREEIPKQDITPEMGRSNHDRYVWCIENVLPDFERPPNAADFRRAVERGADLVVADSGLQLAQASENGRQMRGHPIRITASTFTGNPNSTTLGEARQGLVRRWVEEKNRRYAVRC